MNSKSVQKQKGIALLAVLAVSVTLSILIGAATVVMQKQLSISEDARELAVGKAAVHAKTQELIYLLSTQRVTRAGVSKGSMENFSAKVDGVFTTLLTGDEIRADGHKYIEGTDELQITYSIQATNGLIPINSAEQFWLKKWLKGYGVDNFTAQKLADSLADFADEDNWTRPSGAETFSYNRNNYAPPTNFLMQTCSELYSVMHWNDAIKQYKLDLSECSVSRSGIININAINENLIKRLLSDSGLERAKVREANRWIINAQEASLTISSLTGVDDNRFTVTAKSQFIIEVSGLYSTQKVALTIGLGSITPITYALR
ncbi:hypothetical protein [Alteromonas gracilis]|uniref:hypothetical protein n=1 Tax=Alteromonas gracilis TaxID=1479524 RepID=UPI0030D2FFF9